LDLTPSSWGYGAAIYVFSFMPGLHLGSSHVVAVWGWYDRSAERRLR